MKRKWSVLALLASVSLFPGKAQAIDCSTAPTHFNGKEFPKGNFFSNFDNACYLIPFTSSGGTPSQDGDLNSVYHKLWFKVDPRYQIIIVGTFPQTRFFSITATDAHAATSQTISDVDMVPLTSSYINPYAPGAAFVAGQKYAVPLNFGGTPGTLETGCRMTGFNVDVNGMDATQRHQGMDWNSDPAVWKQNPNFPHHIVDTPQHTNPNTAGVIMVREYLDITPAGTESLYAIVRDVASGCAYPNVYAENTLQIVTDNVNIGNTWTDSTQAGLHRVYEHDYQKQLCFASNPKNMLAWRRQQEYVPGTDPVGSYITATVPANQTQKLAAAGSVMRIRFQMPVTPPTPNGCCRSGNEQMRYLSLSFQSPGGHTLASVADSAFTQDPNGYVTLIVGTGATIPSWITPANGYTFLDLTAISGYQQLTSLNLRNILPAGTFGCSGEMVPYHTGVASPAGGLMGNYLPMVDYPPAARLQQVAGELPPLSSCAVFPDGVAGVAPNCAVVTPQPVSISAVSTQCAAPGCNQVVVQAQPPLSINGHGFGNFPLGIPFTGTSGYLQITDTTQNWDAGYTGDLCTVTISSWAANLIELVANVNQNGVCPLAAGDQLNVRVWNPESLTDATVTVTVAGN